MNLLSSYDQFRKTFPAQGAFAAYRDAAYSYANTKGLPTRSDEDWHYTSVKDLKDGHFLPSHLSSTTLSVNQQEAISQLLNSEFTHIVFVNGIYEQSLSATLPEGVVFKEYADFSDHFRDSFEALNGAYQVRPNYICVQNNVSVEKPIQFIFYSTNGDGTATMSHPRIRIDVGSRSSVSFMESYYGVKGQTYLVNSVFDLRVGESAKVSYVRKQSDSLSGYNLGRSQVQLSANSHLEFLAFAVGAKLSRHSLELTFLGQGASSEVLGVYALSANQHLDNTTVIDHAVGGCSSNQLYKGILGGESRGVFCGKVIIQKNAQKANSAQLNNNLLLSSKAEADSKPNLEIYADDVKASHGSTVGQLNQDEVFYLQSRGIPRSTAVRMLSQGFLLGVIYKLSDVRLRTSLTSHLQEVFNHKIQDDVHHG